MAWDTDDIVDSEIIKQDGVFAYLFTASGTIYAGQSVKIQANNTVTTSAGSDDGVGIATMNTLHGNQIGVFGPGNMVYAVIDGAHAAGTALYAGADGVMTDTQGSAERVMAYVVEAGVAQSTNYKAKVLLV
jgi:predicted RecA/RadA family phage recombinase